MEPAKYLKELKLTVAGLFRRPDAHRELRRSNRKVMVKFVDRNVYSSHY